jgi:hypothetical protein
VDGVELGQDNPIKADDAGNWQFTVTDALTNEDYDFTATATDAAGNVSEASEALSITIDTEAPVAPTIDELAYDTFSNLSGFKPTLTGTGVANTSIQISIKLNDGEAVTQDVDVGPDGKWTFTIDDGVGEYKVSATASDEAGNESRAVLLNFEVVAEPVLVFDAEENFVAGFNTIQAAIDADATGEGATIIVYPGTYNEGAEDVGGLVINKPNLTIQGVDADGVPIETAEEAKDQVIITAAGQGPGSINHLITSAGEGTMLIGLDIRAGAQTTDSKILQIEADGVTVQDSVIRTTKPNTSTTDSAAIYIYESDGAIEIANYTIDGNILFGNITVAAGVSGGTIKNNVFDLDAEGVGNKRSDAIIYQGVVAAEDDGNLSYQSEAASIADTVTGNTLTNNDAPFLLYQAENDGGSQLNADQVADFLDNNFDGTTTWAYVLTNGAPKFATALPVSYLDGSGATAQFAVANNIATLNELYNLLGGADGLGSEVMAPGDTIVVQDEVDETVEVDDTNGVNDTDEDHVDIVTRDILVDDLTIMATDATLGLELVLKDGVHKITLQGTGGVNVKGNELDNQFTFKSGHNAVYGEAGADRFTFSSVDDGLNVIFDFDADEGDKIQLMEGLSAGLIELSPEVIVQTETTEKTIVVATSDDGRNALVYWVDVGFFGNVRDDDSGATLVTIVVGQAGALTADDFILS